LNGLRYGSSRIKALRGLRAFSITPTWAGRRCILARMFLVSPEDED